MNRPSASLCLLAAAILGQGCAATRAIAPLEKGQVAVTSSLGGPIVSYFGGHKPLPQSSIGAVYGYDGRTNFHAAIHPTQLILFGVAGFDLGVSTMVLEPNKARPRVMLDGTIYVFFGDVSPGEPEGGLRVFPDVQVIASWPLGKHHFYAGIDNFLQPFPIVRYYPSPLIGTELRAGIVGFQFETKWVAFYEDSQIVSPDWAGIGNRGAISVQLGLNFYPGKGK